MKKIVVFTGAGISQESGIPTYRDGDDALWKKYDPAIVASINGWKRNKQMCLDFYNYINKHITDYEPNTAHISVAELEKYFDVVVVTQNVDDLHERGGSTMVVHLHGEIRKMRSSVDKDIIMPYINPIEIGQKCPKGSQLRPHVVFFGERPFNLETAAMHISEADIIIIIGTSLQVEPAASLLTYVSRNAKIYVVDKENPFSDQAKFYQGTAVNKVPELINDLIKTT